ncbi:TPA: extracellular solute-binding protein [Candidatus Poribacteria bacterium]|nr:extracellular solute-binding protein [Candidatus Poribacteria bacterium]
MRNKKVIHLIFAVLLIPLTVIFYGCGKEKKQESKSLTVVSWGGVFQDAQREAFFKPFAEKFGVEVKEESYSGEYARIEAMVNAKDVKWDVIEVESNFLLSATKKGLLEPMDYKVIDKSKLIETAIHPNGVATIVWATVLAWNKDRLPKGVPPPSSWKDFWDVNKYPGLRGLRKTPRVSLEMALLVDGVTPDKLYPIDVERALKKLDEIKPHISWWTSGADSQQKLVSECVLTNIWNGRAWATLQDGKPVDMTLNQGFLDYDWWVVPKGAKNKKLAMKFIDFASNPEGQIAIANKFGYGPPNKTAFRLMDNKTRKYMPSDPNNLPMLIRFDAQWWAENEAWITEKWNEWLLK